MWCVEFKLFQIDCVILRLSKCSDWTKCDCYVRLKEWPVPDTDNWVKIYLESINIKHSASGSKRNRDSSRAEAEVESSSFSGRSCASKKFRGLGFLLYMSVLVSWAEWVCPSFARIENFSLYLPVFEWSEVLWCDYCPCVTSLMARFENSEQHIPAH